MFDADFHNLDMSDGVQFPQHPAFRPDHARAMSRLRPDAEDCPADGPPLPIPTTATGVQTMWSLEGDFQSSLNRFRRLLTAVAALAAGSLLVIPAAGAAEMQKLDVIEHAGGEVVTDLGDKGDSAGDLLTFENEVYDDADSQRVGSIHGWCIRVIAGKSWECFWTLFHDDGQITVEGPFFDAGDSTVAITGGTGKFAGVRGDMLLHARNAEGTAYDLKYSLMY